MDSPSPPVLSGPSGPSPQIDGKPEAINKPLPPNPPTLDDAMAGAPSQETTSNFADTMTQNPGPSPSATSSFQRPKKRVIWRNKGCMIALPIDSDYGKKSSAEKYLGPEDVEQRLKEWESQGFDTRGFLLAPPTPGYLPCFKEGQSRAIHPDPEEQRQERSERDFQVNIPDQREWEDYVTHLKEEKLRALGVSFGDEEQPRKSPAPSLMSRQTSSQSSARLNSPGLVPNSVHSMPFPPGFHNGPNAHSYLGKPAVSHFPRYSVAVPPGEKPFTSPNQFSQPSQSPVYGNWSTQPYAGSQPTSRVASPMINGRGQGINGALSPGPYQLQNTQVSSQDSWQRQQAMLQAQQQQQSQIQRTPSSPGRIPPTADPKSPVGLHKTSDIASPIPRGHRQNPSETLQREIDEGKYHQRLSGSESTGKMGSVQDAHDTPIDEDTSTLGSKHEGLAKDNSKGAKVEKSNGVSDTPDKLSSTPGSPRPGHSSTKILSTLNANAPEFKFEPKEPLGPPVFAFLGDQPSKTSEKTAGSTPSTVSHSTKVSDGLPIATKLNVAAPEFTPGVPRRRPSISSREFSFSASIPTFRPDAPSSKPKDVELASDSEASKTENPVEAVKKIFGDVKFSEVIKPSKKSKAIPIIKPDVNAENLEDTTAETDGQEDESGRITQADGRQKRMRRDVDDGDQVPLFASPNQTPWMDHGYNNKAAYFSRTPSPVSEKADATTIEAATDLLEEIIDDLSATEASNLMAEDLSSSGDSESFEAHAFHDIDDAASFNAARPLSSVREADSQYLNPTPDDVAKATVDFLAKSPQFKADFNEALARRVSGSRSPNLLEGPQHQVSNSHRTDDRIDRVDYARHDIMDGVRYVEPSYHELDAIMKHLNEDSDCGIERRPSPFKRRGQSMSPVRSSAPEHYHASRSPVRDAVHELYSISTTPQLLPPGNVRSDVPSPSPNRLGRTVQYLPQTDSESANTSAIENIEQIARDIAENPLDSPSWPARNAIPVHHLNSPGSTPPSDWNDAISSIDEDKFHSRTGFFDSRVNDLVGSVVQQRLGPLEQIMSGIQQSLTALSRRSASRRPRSSGTLEVVDSDADDEEDTQESPHLRLKSPLKDRKYDQLKSSINEITAAQQQFAPAAQLVEVIAALKDLKSSIPQAQTASNDVADIKNIVEEAVGKQLRGRSAPVTSSSVAAVAEKSQLQIAGLESMLKIAEARADEELKARRSTEDALADSQRLLRTALEDAAEQRESAEETERSLEEYSEERQDMLQCIAVLEGSKESLESTISQYSDKNTALEETLAEYRLSHDQWRTEIDDARHENKDLHRHINSLKDEIDEVNESRQLLRTKFDRLQQDMAQSSQDVIAEQLRRKTTEGEHSARLEMLSTRLEAEARTRERLELEIERLEAQEKEIMQARSTIEHTQKSNVQLHDVVTELRAECLEHQRAAARCERELHDARESMNTEIHRTRTAMEVDVEAANNQVKAARGDLEDVISRSQKQVEDMSANANITRDRNETLLAEVSASREAALQEAANAHEVAIQEHQRIHERTLGETKSQLERALENALEDKERSETYFGHRLNLADEKAVHYQDRIRHLEERLEITKDATHAAVQAAQANKASTSAGSNQAIQSLTKAAGIPEKISPQALRESILVLQEQLQQREGRIEQLESELTAVDTTAPAKLKEAEVEISWLRELLGVRYDELQDIIVTLSQPTYSREAVKDAAIRLKANLQMEQQEKERALAGSQSFPSLSSISTLAASPKALPLAAAAAWGNWRKSRDTGFGSMNALANGSAQQTPSKSSPQSFFAGLMTPPSTDMRTTPPVASNTRPPSSSSKYLIRSPSTPKQNVNRNDMRLQQDPVTPPLMRKASYDPDASESVSGFGDEGIEGSKMAGGDEEPFGPRLGGIVGTM